MNPELSFIESLRRLAGHPAARGLLDDAAVLNLNTQQIVLTHDTLVEGVHFLASDPPETVAWKLVAVNLSDLAAKGARPIAALMSYAIAGNPEWDLAFVAGLEKAVKHFNLALIGGDTVSSDRRFVGIINDQLALKDIY